SGQPRGGDPAGEHRVLPVRQPGRGDPRTGAGGPGRRRRPGVRRDSARRHRRPQRPDPGAGGTGSPLMMVPPIPFARSPTPTLGVEWEIALVDSETRDLALKAEEVIDLVKAAHPEVHLEKEFLQNIV